MEPFLKKAQPALAEPNAEEEVPTTESESESDMPYLEEKEEEEEEVQIDEAFFALEARRDDWEGTMEETEEEAALAELRASAGEVPVGVFLGVKRALEDAPAQPEGTSSALMTLEEMMALGFYELLGCEPGAHARTVHRRFQSMAKRYHPDKGGSDVAFRYLKLVADVLKDPATRAEYDRDGKDRWVCEFRRANTPSGGSGGTRVVEVPPPPVNRAFLGALLRQRGALEHYVGDLPFAGYLEAVLGKDAPAADRYEESDVACKLGLKLRLVAKGARASMPVYPQPRVVRHAAFMGVDVVELDVPASHGQQALKYARKHVLPLAALEAAFASTEAIVALRSSLGFPAGVAKGVVSLLVGGAGLAKIKVLAGVSELPVELYALHKELAGVRRHMMDTCPVAWKEQLQDAEHPALTLASWHLQIGEREDLDAVAAKLPDGIVVHGWLGDSILVSATGFDADAFCAEMEQHALFITPRRFAASADEYYQRFEAFTGHSFNRAELTERQKRRQQALEYGQRWLRYPGADGKPVKKPPMPHLEFAIAIEAELPTKRNPRTGRDELYVPEDGVWLPSGGDIKGEVVSDALLKVFAPREWQLVSAEGARKKWRLVPGDEPLFRTGPALASIGEMCKHLRFDPATVNLDEGVGVEKLKNFRGPL